MALAATVDADGLPNVRMVLLKSAYRDGFVFLHQHGKRQGPRARRPAQGRAGAALEIAAPAGARPRRRRARERRRGRRLLRLAPARLADRRLGLVAIAPARQPGHVRGRHRGGRRALRGVPVPRPRTGPATASGRSASSSGPTGRSGCTTASCFARPAPRRAVHAPAPVSLNRLSPRGVAPAGSGLPAPRSDQHAVAGVSARRGEAARPLRRAVLGVRATSRRRGTGGGTRAPWSIEALNLLQEHRLAVRIERGVEQRQVGGVASTARWICGSSGRDAWS